MPASLQLIGPSGSEEALVAAGLRIEEAIARDYSVTEEMARFRWNTTGVARQVAASRKGAH